MNKQWLWGTLPLLLLAGLLLLFFWHGPAGVLRQNFPPLEELTIERVELPTPDLMIVHVVNGGPEPVTIAQVAVDEALWQFRLEPEEKTVPRLGRRKIYLPYPWVEGEAHEVKLISSTGVTFSAQVSVATQSPRINWTYMTTFALLGLYAGVIPVFLGLLWYPFLRDLGERWLSFFLSLTVGLLFFLGVDTLEEALETSAKLAGAYQGVALIAIGMTATLLLLFFVSHSKPERADKANASGRFWTASMIALGIGLHNLGEGLAIGSAYSLGEIALGTFLVVGFTLHNLTEGLGIVAPIAKDKPGLSRLLSLGAVAGLPTVLGAWLGGFAYSALWATLFLSIGAGAILQVIYEILQLFKRSPGGGWINLHNTAGFLLGLSVMYLTGLLIVT